MDGHDELRGGTGADLLSGGAGADTIRGLGGGDTISGGSGRDIARFDDAMAALAINLELAGDQQTGGAGMLRIGTVEDLVGGAFNDTLAGNASANDLRGGGGDDRLFGRDGHDRLYGGDGADTLDGGAGNDSLYGEGGVDTASYQTAASGVVVDLAVTVTQFTWGSGWDLLSSIANLTGSTHADILRGNSGANVLRDLEGADLVEAGGGHDTVFAGIGGADTYDGGTGSDLISFAEQCGGVIVDLAAGTASGLGIFFDTVLGFENATGGALADSIAGTTAGNRLEGGAGHDSLSGREGNDTLTGGAGADTLNGGAGADRFVFDARGGNDLIADFQIGLDRIVFEGGPAGMADLTFTRGTILYGDGQSITLTGVNAGQLTAADFLFA
jgi:Ca2+-binding RTX toxin-like protein